MNHLREIRNTFKDIRQLQGKPNRREPKSSKIKTLRTRIWIESILHEQRISVKELSSIFYSGKESTGTVMRWLKGRQSAGPNSVKKIAEVFPDSDEIYNLAVFDLLESEISKGRIHQLLKTYTHNSHPATWKLPPFKAGNHERSILICKDDSEQLFQRGDIYGFMAILILLREAELNNDVIRHEIYLKDAYRAFPGFCRDKRFKKRWEEFYASLVHIHYNMYSSARLVEPKKEVIKAQIFAKEHRTFRLLRPRSPIDGRFIEPEKPYREAGFR